MCIGGHPARWEFPIGTHIITVHFLPVPYWLAVRIFHSSLREDSTLHYGTTTDIVGEILEHCIVRVELDYCEVDKYDLPLGVTYFLVNAILTFNGLTPAGEKKLSQSLNFLKEFSLSQFQEKEWAGRQPPPYFSVIMLSYFSINKGIPFSQKRLVDEPYVLVQSWMSIADAEHTHYKLLEEKSKSDTKLDFPSAGHQQPTPQDLTQILHDKFSFPIPPLPQKKGS